MKLFLAVLLLSFLAEARVFDMNSEKFAAYFRGNYGPTSIGKGAFEKASAFNETYNNELKTITAGEFGFVYAASFMNTKFAIEVIRPPSLKGTNATDANDNSLYSLDSDISAVIPKIGFEFNLKKWKAARLFLNSNFGTGTLILSNAYTFTTAGTALTGKTDFTEEGRSTSTMIEGNLGIEFLMFDTTTMTLDIGYRSLKFTTITHNRTASTLMGDKVKGDPMLNTDGTAREIDLSGAYASLGFRFWLF